MDRGTSISLVDKTIPSQQLDDELSESTGPSQRFSRRWRKKGKYAKWQPQKLGATNGTSSQAAEAGRGPDKGATHNVDAVDFAASDQGSVSVNGNRNDTADQTDNVKPVKELDILYENQRGWFLFGVPLYSHRSLLNFDPSAWVTQELKDSPVNITNAQLPDPSWKWAWHTWYVDMSGDVDEHGWQYSWSFSSSAWHGSHPWFHSFVRRRRWVRLRVKRERGTEHRPRSGLEKAHMLNADYFTIHSSKRRTIAPSETQSSRLSNYLSRASTKVNEEFVEFEEIADIPTLKYALKVAIVDREKMEALKRFVQDGGEELYYLDQRIPEFMAMFIFQTSRWQFLTYLTGVVDELSRKSPKTEGIQRRYDNLARAVETAKSHVRGPVLFGNGNRAAVTKMLNLSPTSKQNGLLSRFTGKAVEDVDHRESIRGIPRGAEIGREGHIH